MKISFGYYAHQCSEGVAVLLPHEDRLKLRSCLLHMLARVGGSLIPHEDKLKLGSCSIYWPEGVVVLIPYEE